MQVPALLRAMSGAGRGVSAPAPAAPPCHGRRRPATHDLCLTGRAAAEATAHAREPPAAAAMLQLRRRRSAASWPAQAGHPRLVPNREGCGRSSRPSLRTPRCRRNVSAPAPTAPPSHGRCRRMFQPWRRRSSVSWPAQAGHPRLVPNREGCGRSSRPSLRTPRRCRRDVSALAPAAPPCHGRRRPATHDLCLPGRAAAEAAAHAFEPPAAATGI